MCGIFVENWNNSDYWFNSTLFSAPAQALGTTKVSCGVLLHCISARENHCATELTIGGRFRCSFSESASATMREKTSSLLHFCSKSPRCAAPIPSQARCLSSGCRSTCLTCSVNHQRSPGFSVLASDLAIATFVYVPGRAARQCTAVDFVSVNLRNARHLMYCSDLAPE
jgi:hypothetical protein